MANSSAPMLFHVIPIISYSCSMNYNELPQFDMTCFRTTKQAVERVSVEVPHPAAQTNGRTIMATRQEPLKKKTALRVAIPSGNLMGFNGF